MTRTVAMLRLGSAIWLAVFLLVLTVLATVVIIIPLKMPEGYPLAMTAAGASVIFLVAPVCAAWAAWEGGRLRRAHWSTAPHARPMIVVAVMALIPSFVAGVVAIATAIGVGYFAFGAVGLPDLRIVAKTVALLLAHLLFGYAVGLHLPTVVAIPAMLLGDYLWMVIPITLQPFWVRHLNGTWLSCCSVDYDLDPRALAATLIVAGGIAAAAIVLIRGHLNLGYLASALVLVVLAVGVGRLLVQDLGPDPTTPRDASVLVCSADSLHICVWPEHRERLPEVQRAAADLHTRWREAGLAVPSSFSEDRATIGGDTAHFAFSLESRPDDLRVGLAMSLLPPAPACAYTGAARYSAATMRGPLTLWLAMVGGVPEAVLRSRYSPAMVDAAVAMRALPFDHQRDWYERAIPTLRTCDAGPAGRTRQ